MEGGPAGRGRVLAPDLAHTRARVRPAALVRFLRRPSDVLPGAVMPSFDLEEADARDLAAFVLEQPLDAPKPASIPARLPILSRRVGWDEVEARVFKKTCWHCHSDPDLALGDGGPGNTGGFGFAARGLSFASYRSLLAGARGPDGAWRSPFALSEDGTPRLVAHLVARWVESAGKEVPGVRGMPLGLPPLSPEDVQLVESWIAQGRPR